MVIFCFQNIKKNSNAIKSISRSGVTFTATKLNNTTFTFTQQDNNTTYANYKGATTAASGTAGLVPAASTANRLKFLRGDATWQIPNNTTYGLASTSANGLLRQLDNNGAHFMCGQGTWKAPITSTEIGHITGKGSGYKVNFNPGNYKIIIIHGWIIDIGVSFTGFGPYIVASQQRKYPATGGYNTPTYPGPWMLFYIDTSGIYISEVRSNGNDVANNQTGFYVYGINW